MRFLKLMTVVAVLIAGLGRVIAAGGVTVKEDIVSFCKGIDTFIIPLHSSVSRIGYDDAGRMHLQGTNECTFIRFSRLPDSRPFRGASEVVLSSEGSVGSQLELVLKNRDTGKTKSVKAEWKRETHFVLDLPPDEFWQFYQLGFVFGRRVAFDVVLKSLIAVSSVDSVRAIALEADTGSPLFITTDPVRYPAFAVLTNRSDGPVSFDGELVAANYFGEKVVAHVRDNLESGGVARVRLDVMKVPHPYGIWRVEGVLRAGGKTLTNETRFAVLNLNRTTPRLANGRFKMGINYHMGWLTPRDVDLTLDALNACGCKLVRAEGWSAGECWKKRECLDFTWSDWRMARLKARGLSLNTDCWPNAQWMAKPENRNKPYRTWRDSRTMPGVMGEYAGKLAARYGEDIEFLETSNEADLWREGMTADEYIEYQKEVYVAVKKAAPGIKVLTSAFAAADSSNPMVTRKGYQESILVGARGFYDIHPTHQHSGFGAYESDILTKFLPMRERIGVTVPWYANETAVTGVNGAEDGVAKNVWMKILFSWAHGSVSYIWYNLRATGWAPGDSEQWYGLLTADNHPRAGFAAFSALAYAVSELDLDRLVDEHKGRHLYSFRGIKNGISRWVLAGWDAHTDPPHRIRVKTDAKKAWTTDIMGNVKPAERYADGYVFPISKHPGALVLEDVGSAEPNADDVATVPAPNIKAMAVKANVDGRRPDWHLFKWWHVRDLYAGNPETIERTWKGPDDHSVAIWIGRTDTELHLRFDVTDDIHCQKFPSKELYLGDGLQFILESTTQSGNFEIGLSATDDLKPLKYTWITPVGFKAEEVTKAIRLDVVRRGPVTVYHAYLPLKAIGFDESTLSTGFRFNAIVYDNDGIGRERDAWIEIVPGIAGKKDYADSPYVRIVQ